MLNILIIATEMMVIVPPKEPPKNVNLLVGKNILCYWIKDLSGKYIKENPLLIPKGGQLINFYFLKTKPDLIRQPSSISFS